MILMPPKSNSKRLKAAKLAEAVNMIEGVPVSANAQKLSAQWVRGEITGEAMKAALVVAHTRQSDVKV